MPLALGQFNWGGFFRVLGEKHRQVLRFLTSGCPSKTVSHDNQGIHEGSGRAPEAGSHAIEAPARYEAPLQS